MGKSRNMIEDSWAGTMRWGMTVGAWSVGQARAMGKNAGTSITKKKLENFHIINL